MKYSLTSAWLGAAFILAVSIGSEFLLHQGRATDLTLIYPMLRKGLIPILCLVHITLWLVRAKVSRRATLAIPTILPALILIYALLYPTSPFGLF